MPTDLTNEARASRELLKTINTLGITTENFISIGGCLNLGVFQKKDKCRKVKCLVTKSD